MPSWPFPFRLFLKHTTMGRSERWKCHLQCHLMSGDFQHNDQYTPTIDDNLTRGNSGIGLATARAFHANGAKVVISGRDSETLEEVARESGHDVLAVQADVSKLSEIDQLMARAYETFGKLDILFVNAGIYKGASLEDVDEATFDEMLNTNFKGAYFTVRKALPFG
jgi:NAD(P)-dependent dehydrogenase (short-subunit alcohol dehydrogenase family)